jgi:hypothetical protein
MSDTITLLASVALVAFYAGFLVGSLREFRARVAAVNDWRSMYQRHTWWLRDRLYREWGYPPEMAEPWGLTPEDRAAFAPEPPPSLLGSREIEGE